MKEEDERNKNTNPKKKRKTARKKEATGQPTHNEAIFQVIQVGVIDSCVYFSVLLNLCFRKRIFPEKSIMKF
jgi:site-specific recombinase